MRRTGASNFHTAVTTFAITPYPPIEVRDTPVTNVVASLAGVSARWHAAGAISAPANGQRNLGA